MNNKYCITKEKIEKDYSKQHKLSSIFSILFFLAFFISSFSLNVQAADSSLVNEVRNIVKNKYVTPVPDNVLNSPTIEGIVKGLNDPYSQYFSKQQQQDFVNSIDNKTCGIGIYLEIIPEGVKVSGVIEKSPAEEVGIKVGDIIVSADGQSLVGLPADKASSYIKGEEGTTVKVEVKRENSILNFGMTRKSISIPTVTGAIVNGHTAYIHITSFGEDTAELFTKKVQELRMRNPENYIVDLRNNGGGYMRSALDIAGHFIGENPAIMIEGRDGKKLRYLADDKGSTIDKPIVFLINQYSASASEILAAAVKDYNKAFFIGTTTYGKGVAQQMFELSDGSSLKLTTENFYSPKGNKIQKVGILPDFEVKDINSSLVAELFSGKCENSVDKRGYVKVNVDGNEFEIDLKLAKEKKYWEPFKYIVNKVGKDNIYIGTENGWVNTDSDYINNIYKFLYGNYKQLDTLKDVPENKAFTVTFNKSIDQDTIEDYTNIEIIDSATGERAAFDINKVDDKKISITPKESLKKGQTYYIKIKDVIKPFTVKS